MNRITILSLLLAAIPCACSSAEPRSTSPQRLTNQIVTHLEAGEYEAASELFENSSENAQRGLYSSLMSAGEESYDTAQDESAVAIFFFMADHYPDSPAAQEALLYSLFIQRTKQEEPTREQIDEIGTVLENLPESLKGTAWVALVETQYWIDRNRPAHAQAAYENFQGIWNGRPSFLSEYVMEIERWLESNA